MANNAQLAARTLVGGKDVTDGRLGRVVLNVQGQPIGIRYGKLARTQIRRVVAHALCWRVSISTKNERRCHLS